MKRLRIPLATYRLQFHKGFTLADARQIVPYLERLGISDVFASPLLKARRDSTHGYDIVDHSQINPQIGTLEELEQFADELRQRSMGLVMDIVPNHMGIDDPDNHWWQDVLENGPSSPYASHFDIDWSPPKPDLRNRVLLPFLGDQYGKVLENGEIQLKYDRGSFRITYYERSLPVDPSTAHRVLELALEHVRYATEPNDPERMELESIVTALGYLPKRTETDPAKVEERQREKEVTKRRLDALVESSGPVRRAIEAAVQQFNVRPGDPASVDALEQLLADQVYRLCYWRVAADEINYRRFFDINELAAIRVEEPAVFDASHAVALNLLSEGRLQGMRIDHPDGLFEPEKYFLKLQAACRSAITGEEFRLPKLVLRGLDCACYVVVEKILCAHERLPQDWSVHGTTGYEVLNWINAIFVDTSAEAAFRQFYRTLCQRALDFDEALYECKKLILNVSMSSELHMLARRLERISTQHRWSRDFTFFSLYDALAEVVARFPVYRTYTRYNASAVDEADRRHIDRAIRAAKRRNPATDPSIFDFIASVLLLEDPPGISDEHRVERRDFVMRFQQLTGPVMAKGFEDTLFYRLYTLASLNEVGGEPSRFGITLEEFHRLVAERHQNWPYAMTTTSTHDTKRSQDVRARINVLSEIPGAWQEAVLRWHEQNRPYKVVLDNYEVPDANEEYLLYQTLVGTWPWQPPDDARWSAYVERIQAYMEKAVHEAKVHTSWINPAEEYDQAVVQFVRRVLSREDNQAFLHDLDTFCQRIAYPGMCNALAQLVFKIGLPGVADFYQGTELWDDSLVDPDNRRPVDFSQRAQLLEELARRESADRDDLVADLAANWRDGRLKLYVLWKGLHLRRGHPEMLLEGDYLVPEITGPRRDHVAAFVRHHASGTLLVVVPRLMASLVADNPPPDALWQDTQLRLPEAEYPAYWTDAFTGQSYRFDPGQTPQFALRQLLARLPVAMLLAEAPAAPSDNEPDKGAERRGG